MNSPTTPRSGGAHADAFALALPALVFSLVVASTLGAEARAAGEDPAAGGEVSTDEFVEWVEERAIPLDSLDWRDVDPARLAATLDPLLEGKRVVYIGESDHFIAERLQARLVLIRYLAERGFRNIGMEAGVSDSRRIDRYVETGDRRHLARVALYGYDGDQRYDRVDTVAGWTDDAHPEFSARSREDVWWFLSELREIERALPPGGPRLRWFGYDMNMRPGGGYADAYEVLALHGADPTVRELKARLARVPGESRLEEYRRLLGVLVFLEDQEPALSEVLGADAVADLAFTLHALADGVRWIESMQDLSDRPRVDAGLRERERTVCRQLDRLVGAAPPGEKFILLGHAIHLSKDSTTIELDRELWPTWGRHVAQTLPGQVFGIWLLFDRGEHGVTRLADPIRRFPTIPGSVEHLLAGAGPAFLLPFGSGDPREAWLDEPRTVRFMTQPARARLPAETDAVFFVREATALRPR